MPRRGGGSLREREGALAAVDELLSQAAGGGGGALFLLGEGGMGKTSLLEEAARLAGSRFTVGRARGYTMEQDLPFAVAAQALESLGGGAVVDPPAVAADPVAARMQVLTSARAWLEQRSAQGPVLLLLDDLHWADGDSLALIGFLCRRLAQAPLAVVATARPWPTGGSDLAEQLARDGASRSLHLSPLSRPASAELLAERSGAELSEERAGRAWELTAGNPLLVERLGAMLGEGGDLPGAGAEDLPGLRRALLLAYAAELPPTALRVATAGAVLGDRFRAALVGRVADLDPSEAAEGLEVCQRAGLVRTAGGGMVEFVHPLIDQALRDDLPASRRAGLHARAFVVLDEAGETAAAAHALAGDLAGDPRAVAVTQAAGEQALGAGAVRTAVARLEGAVRLAGGRPPPGLLTALALALLSAGEADEAVEVSGRLVGGGALPEEVRAEVLRLHGWALSAVSRHDDAVAALAEAETLAADSGTAAALLVDRAAIEFHAFGPGAAAATLARAASPAGATHDVLRAIAAVAAVQHLGEVGDLAALEAAARAQAAGTLPLGRAGAGSGAAPASAPRPRRSEPLVMFGAVAGTLERFADEAWAYAEGTRLAEEAGAPLMRATLAIGHAYALWRQGRLAEAQALLEATAPVAELAPQIGLFVGLQRAVVAASAGETERARTWYAEVEPHVEAAPGWLGRLWLRHIRAELALAGGDVQAACGAADEAQAIAREAGVGEPCLVPWAGVAARAWIAAGRVDDAVELAGWLEATSAGLPCRWPGAVAKAIRAQRAERHGDLPAAEQGFEEALRLLSEVDLPLDRARVLLAYGGMLRRAGQRRRAGEHLAEALAICERTGAAGLAEQARAELALAGGRQRGGRAPSDLTPAQVRVAELAIGGATTQEIAAALVVSPRTVESHLAQIYAKVGVRSRRELAERADILASLIPATDVRRDEPRP